MSKKFIKISFLTAGLILFGILSSLFYIHRNDTPVKDYQLNVKTDSVYVWDNGRFIGPFIYGQNRVLDSLIINDNQ